MSQMPLRAHSKSTPLNALSSVVYGHMVVPGASHNAKQQHGSVSQRKTTFVQLMLLFSSEDLLTFCLLNAQADSCLLFLGSGNNLSVQHLVSRESEKFAWALTE